MAEELITYSETFASPQGEGIHTGVPTVWFRFFRCNLQCNGFGQKDPTNPDTFDLPYKDFDASTVNRLEDLPVWTRGCDSSYSWSKKFAHLQHTKSVVEICDELESLMKNSFNPGGMFFNPHSNTYNHLCFTGGEPLLKKSQEGVVNILQEFNARDNVPAEITFETNGTQYLTDELVNHFNWESYSNVLFSVSPKLYTVSGETNLKAIRPEVVASYQQQIWNSQMQLKFVMGAEERQWDELERVVKQFRNAGVDAEVQIMPVGATEEAQDGVTEGYASAGDIADMAKERGYRVSARMHVYLYGNLIGV